MSRRVVGMTLMMLCLLLSACAPLPMTQPPADSKMRDSWVQIQDGEVHSMSINTWTNVGSKVFNYALQQNNGVRWCGEVETGGGGACEVPYSRFMPVLEAVMARVKEDRFGLPEGEDPLFIWYTAFDAHVTNADIAAQQPDERTYRGYYVYSQKSGTMIQGDGIECGIEALGRFTVQQPLPSGDAPGFYVFITQ